MCCVSQSVKMLCLILATVVVPSVLGCCMPFKFRGFTYDIETQEQRSFVMDFSSKKFINHFLDPDSTKAFRLTDFSAGEVYTMLKDGRCLKTTRNLQGVYNRCIPSERQRLEDRFLGPQGKLDLEIYTYKAGPGDIILSVSADKCYPVITNAVVLGQSKTTVYGSIDEVVNDSDFNVDLTNCTDQLVG